MPQQEKDTKFKDLITQLKNLSPEDRMLLGLYLYEGLTSEQVNSVLNVKSQVSGKKKSEKNIVAKGHYNSL